MQWEAYQQGVSGIANKHNARVPANKVLGNGPVGDYARGDSVDNGEEAT